jgi:DNA-binding NarL/FixJ family response regulator
MRKLLHMNSRVQSSTSRAELWNLNLNISPHFDRTVRQADSSPIIRSNEEARVNAAAPASTRQYSDAHVVPCRPKATNSNAPRAATDPRDASSIDVQDAPSVAQHDDAVNGLETATNPKPSIVVIDSRAVFRDCFVKCLEISYRDHEIFSFTNLLEWYGSKQPNALAPAVVIVVVIDNCDFNSASLEFLETAAADIPVVIVSDVDDLDHIVRTLKSGVRGYIPTSLPYNVAVEAVRLVKAGGTFVPASSFVHDRNELQPALKSGVSLTERQMKVVEEIRHGKANKQIAYELNMSEHTVKVHLRHIMKKLKARNRTEVAVLSGDLFPESRDQHRELLGGSGKDLPPM